jgi:hypothetical protein
MQKHTFSLNVLEEVDEEILSRFDKMNIDKRQARKYIQSNQHNTVTTIYYLLLKQKLKTGGTIVTASMLGKQAGESVSPPPSAHYTPTPGAVSPPSYQNQPPFLQAGNKGPNPLHFSFNQQANSSQISYEQPQPDYNSPTPLELVASQLIQEVTSVTVAPTNATPQVPSRTQQLKLNSPVKQIEIKQTIAYEYSAPPSRTSPMPTTSDLRYQPAGVYTPPASNINQPYESNSYQRFEQMTPLQQLQAQQAAFSAPPSRTQQVIRTSETITSTKTPTLSTYRVDKVSIIENVPVVTPKNKEAIRKEKEELTEQSNSSPASKQTTGPSRLLLLGINRHSKDTVDKADQVVATGPNYIAPHRVQEIDPIPLSKDPDRAKRPSNSSISASISESKRPSAIMSAKPEVIKAVRSKVNNIYTSLKKFTAASSKATTLSGRSKNDSKSSSSVSRDKISMMKSLDLVLDRSTSRNNRKVSNPSFNPASSMDEKLRGSFLNESSTPVVTEAEVRKIRSSFGLELIFESSPKDMFSSILTMMRKQRLPTSIKVIFI